jgi:hypothetical protein
MPDEISKAEWKALTELRHLRFTRMAENTCRILLKQEELKEQNVKLTDLPVGDLFRTTSLTPEDYELFGMKNTFYSSEYIKQFGELLKSKAAPERHKL